MEIICYGCGKAEYPENTLIAIGHCQRTNKEWAVEMDLQLTCDGHIVLFHDTDTFAKTGKRGVIADLTLKEVRQLNPAYNFQLENDYPYRTNPVQIPTLEEVLTTFPEITLVLDSHCDRPNIVDKIYLLLAKYHQLENTVLVSEYDIVIKYARKKYPDLTYAAAKMEVIKSLVTSRFYLQKLSPFKSEYLMIPEHLGRLPLLSKQVIDHAHRRQAKIVLWQQEKPIPILYRSAEDVIRLASLGVDGIFTDSPERLRDDLSLRKKRSDKSEKP